MLRWKVAGVVIALGLLVGGGAVMRVGASVLPAGTVAAPPKVLQIFYTPPVLARAGERVTIPVDVICATEGGEPCAASATLTVSAAGRVQSLTAEAVKGLEFDVTAPARRALGSNASGRVDFALTAKAAGRTVRLPAIRGQMLSFYVTRSMPIVQVPVVPFGKVRKGKTVLSLPWGSGPRRVGLAPGMESQTLGPSSFDVDRSGRIHLLDALQGRVAVFDGDRLVREAPLQAGPRAVISVADQGSSFVLDSSRGSLRVQELDSRGRLARRADIGPGIVSTIRVVGTETFANVLPLDAWVDPASGSVSPGLPVGHGRQLVRVGREDAIRLAFVRGDHVLDAVELRSEVNLGAVTLTEARPDGGYLVVLHTWRDAPSPSDQYQVISVNPEGEVRTFAVPDRSFALVPPMARFRLGPDGALYQMTSSPEGIRIVRFDLEEER
jgi:hypothetical protein